jgi:hypothetical protein
MTGLLALAFTWNRAKSRLRCAVFAAHLLAMPWAWLGLLMVPYTAIEGIDGEWLAEHSPTFIAAGLWLLLAGTMALNSGDRSAPLPERVR